MRASERPIKSKDLVEMHQPSVEMEAAIDGIKIEVENFMQGIVQRKRVEIDRWDVGALRLVFERGLNELIEM